MAKIKTLTTLLKSIFFKNFLHFTGLFRAVHSVWEKMSKSDEFSILMGKLFKLDFFAQRMRN